MADRAGAQAMALASVLLHLELYVLQYQQIMIILQILIRIKAGCCGMRMQEAERIIFVKLG